MMGNYALYKSYGVMTMKVN